LRATRSAPSVAVLVGLALAACATGAGRASHDEAPPANIATPPPAAPSPSLPPRGGAVVPARATEPPVRTLAQATIGAVGDVLMHDAVKQSAATHGRGAADAGYSWLYASLADLLTEPDVMFANLETPIAPAAAQGTRPFVFNAPPEAAAALQRAGVDLVSFANNHVFDQGRPGFEETIRRLDALRLRYVGVGPSGRADGPVTFDVGGLRIAFLGYAHFFNQDGNACPSAKPCLQASQLDRAAAVEAVRRAAADADAVVVSLHWGDEYATQPRAEDVDLARRLADAGALVVLGHHPHVLQPVELYRRADGRTAVIAYSLGNFVSNQSRTYVPGVTPAPVAATRDGALLRVTLARRDYGRGVERVEVAGADFLPLWTDNDTVEIDRRKEPERRPAIRVVAVDRALALVRAELAAFPDPVPADRADGFSRLRQREQLLIARRAAAAAVMGEDLLRTLTPGELSSAATAPTTLTPAAATRATR
jgi:Bacterial capsule synthesis protein PGA_cap